MRTPAYYRVRGAVRAVFWAAFALLILAVCSLDSPVLH